jgi:hypothetical protein
MEVASWHTQTLPHHIPFTFWTDCPSKFGGQVVYIRALHWVPIPMPTHTHGFWVGMHGCDVIVHGWAWVGIGFVHPYIQLQIGVKLLGCKEYPNQEGLRAEANKSEQPFICPLQPRLGVGG